MRLTYEDIESNIKSAYFEKNGSNADKNSVEEKIMEAVCAELYGLSCYGDYIMKQSFVQTATGEYLDLLGEMRDCKRKTASKAYGTLRFYNSQPAEEDIPIKAGTICCIADKPYIQFVTTEDGVISSGESSTQIKAEALDVSEKYNAPAGEITVMVNAPVKVESVTNDADFLGGNDEETDYSYRERIIQNYTIPATGTGKKTIENKINALDYVADCKILNTSAPGTVKAVVAVNDDEEITSDRGFEIRDCFGFLDMVGATLEISQPKVVGLNIRMNLILSNKLDGEEIVKLAQDEAKAVFSGKKIGTSVSVSRITKELLKNDYIKDVSVFCSNIVNGVFVCPDDAYLKLLDIRVDCYYEL